MRKARFALVAALALFTFVRPAPCKDFPEPVLAADPLAASSGAGLPAGMGSSFEYGNYAFSHDDVDSFYFRLGASPVILDIGHSFALGAVYESVLMCGPVPSGDVAANVAGFWMNAVQFEYGLYASLALPLPGRPHLLGEYSRTSQHNLRSQYSEVSADILVLGLALPRFSLGPADILSSLRAGNSSLFAFWRSTLPQPRISWFLKPAVEAELPLGGACALVVRAYPEIFIDRFSGLLDTNLFAEAGIALEKGQDSSEILFTLYATRDSDLLRGVAHPTFEAGLALRFSHDRARSPSFF